MSLKSNSSLETVSKKSQIPSRRNKFEIWAECLEACMRERRTQSWLLRELRLKTSAIKDALEFLVNGGLLEMIENPDTSNSEFATTPKGEEALNQYYTLITKYFLLE